MEHLYPVKCAAAAICAAILTWWGSASTPTDPSVWSDTRCEQVRDAARTTRDIDRGVAQPKCGPIHQVRALGKQLVGLAL